MKKVLFVVLAVTVILSGQAPAMAQYDVNWGLSNDTGNYGYDDLNTWFTNNGYSINAQTDYVGYLGADSDPFFFYSETPVNFEVVQRVAGNANLTSFGYYTGAGESKTRTEVLAAGANGPQTANPGGVFGVYMRVPDSYQGSNLINFFTDRAENAGNQHGPAVTNAGGDPQGLIYQLAANEWLIAWEDQDYTGVGSGQTDRDFNDAYLKVSSTVTPEPISMALFGLGGTALAANAARRRKKKE